MCTDLSEGDLRLPWLLASEEPWTRYRTLVDLLDRSAKQTACARMEMIAHPQIQRLVAEAATWSTVPFRRHSDASHPIYKLSTLADFGVQAEDTGMRPILETILARQSAGGAFQSLVNVPKAFKGPGKDMWTWIACDAPTLLYILLAMGLGADERVKQAATHLANLVEENGWRCVGAPELGSFRGPGRKDDPCPIANVYALKALSLVPALQDSPATRAGAKMLLWHWDHQARSSDPLGRKLYMFGIGTDFRKLKYPFVWYNILHVLDVLSRFPFVYDAPAFRDMLKTLTDQADERGRYTASSMYRAWKGWSFADKKTPSPWLTFLAMRIRKRTSHT